MYFLNSVWQWVADSGLNIALIVVLALLVPRAGRLAERIIEQRVKAEQDKAEGKSTLAFAGVGIYIAQVIAYFLLLVWFLQELGFTLAGAAIPATVASAAIGFGAQSIIADFVAGFFILSEKQYGVGDWVRFEGNSIEVEGTVIQITMRATRIRTLAEETVIVPNSTARISVNTSNYWSRAVIVIPVPLLGSANPEEAAQRSEAATRRALSTEEIAPTLLGELAVQPAVSINPPSTVGMPWTIDMRLMIQVEAGGQWAVERAVRMAILEEFWDEYGSATTANGGLASSLEEIAPASRATNRHASPEPTRAWSADDATTAAPAVEGEDAKHAVEDGPAEKSDVPVGRAAADGSDPAASTSTPDSAQTEVLDAAAPTEVLTANADTVADEADEPEKPLTRWQRILTANGRMRASTAWLLVALLFLLIVRALSFSVETEGGERISGPLAPPAAGSWSWLNNEDNEDNEGNGNSEESGTETSEPTPAISDDPTEPNNNYPTTGQQAPVPTTTPSGEYTPQQETFNQNPTSQQQDAPTATQSDVPSEPTSLEPQNDPATGLSGTSDQNTTQTPEARETAPLN